VWDFPDTQGAKKSLGDARSRRFLDAIFYLARHAASCDVISEPMLEEVRAAGAKDPLLVHSGFEPDHLKALENMDELLKENLIRVAYVGTIISESSFRKVLMALDKVRKSLSVPLRLEFFGAREHHRNSWFDSQWMFEHPVFPDQGLVEALRRCSWGIVVMDIEGEDLRYSRFSFPNKTGTYLSAGVPILGFGHQTSTLAGVMKAHPVGKFTSAIDSNTLEKFLLESLSIASPRAFFRDAILECARTEFDAPQMRNRLWEAWGVKTKCI
jgi:hypothetical protein